MDISIITILSSCACASRRVNRASHRSPQHGKPQRAARAASGACDTRLGRMRRLLTDSVSIDLLHDNVLTSQRHR
eukprot:6203409-Pleurochrysis_carterae.AAC.6